VLHPPAQASNENRDHRDIVLFPGLSAWEKYLVTLNMKPQKKILERKGKRTERKRAARAANEEEARRRAVKTATKAKHASEEIVVAPWNTRTIAEKGSNGIGHVETLLGRVRSDYKTRGGAVKPRLRQRDTRCFATVERVGKGRTEWGWQYVTC